MAEPAHDSIRAVEWCEEGVKLLDQRVLPLRREHVVLNDVDGVAQAIRDMVVRGAPAIGVTAAYGVVLAARDRYRRPPRIPLRRCARSQGRGTADVDRGCGASPLG